MNIKELLDSTDDKYIPFKNAKIIEDRCKGNTQRCLDAAIQILFTEGKVLLVDHWEDGTHPCANAELKGKFIKRMFSEFGHKVLQDDSKKGLIFETATACWVEYDGVKKGIDRYKITDAT